MNRAKHPGPRYPGGESVSPEQKARLDALRLLEVRQRSKYELQQRLSRKGHDAATITQVISDLERVGLVNDREFARIWIAWRLKNKPAGKTLLKYELTKKGVDSETIEASLEDALSDIDEAQIALLVARKYLFKEHRYGGDSNIGDIHGDSSAYDNEEVLEIDISTKRRLVSLLKRRGFSYNTIEKVLSRLSYSKGLKTLR
jgi:regulatory protein